MQLFLVMVCLVQDIIKLGHSVNITTPCQLGHDGNGDFSDESRAGERVMLLHAKP